MSTPSELATAFSQHRFEETFAHMRDDVRWQLVGAETVDGKPAVMSACASAADAMEGVPVEHLAFRVLERGDVVVVQSEAAYSEPDGMSRVASCDVYEFVEDQIAAISSYNIELEEEASAGRS